jgi:hypothetical protein
MKELSHLCDSGTIPIHNGLCDGRPADAAAHWQMTIVVVTPCGQNLLAQGVDCCVPRKNMKGRRVKLNRMGTKLRDAQVCGGATMLGHRASIDLEQSAPFPPHNGEAEKIFPGPANVHPRRFQVTYMPRHQNLEVVTLAYY